MKTKSANKISGHLLRIQHTGNYVFRVYNSDYTFTDYDLYHSDLHIIIDDEDATFYYHDDGKSILDHSPETLGIKL